MSGCWEPKGENTVDQGGEVNVETGSQVHC